MTVSRTLMWGKGAGRRLQRRGRDADTETMDTTTAAVAVKMQMVKPRSARQRSGKERLLQGRPATDELKIQLQSSLHLSLRRHHLHQSRHPKLQLQQLSWQLLWVESISPLDFWQPIQDLWAPGRVAWWWWPAPARLIQAPSCSMSTWCRAGRRKKMEVLLVEVESGADHQELLTVLHLVPPLKVLPSILLSSEQLIAADWPKE